MPQGISMANISSVLSYSIPYSLYDMGGNVANIGISGWKCPGIDSLFSPDNCNPDSLEYIYPIYFDTPPWYFTNQLMVDYQADVLYQFSIDGAMGSYITGNYTSGPICEIYVDYKDEGQVLRAYFTLTDGVNLDEPYYYTSIYSDFMVCFLKGTKILFNNEFTKKIEDITIGDKILSYNEKENKIVEDEVIKLQKHQIQANYVIINEKIKVTSNHKMYINNEWKRVENINIGDYMLDYNLNKQYIYSINKYSGPEYVDVYNIKLLNFENYFAEGMLSHNAKCPFIYSICDDGNLIYENTFLYELNSPEKQCIQYRKLKTFTNKFIIKEIEDEISYINYLALRLVDYNNVEYIIKCKDEVLRETTDFSIVLEQGESYNIEFDEFDTNIQYKSIELVCIGYYFEK